MEPIELTKNEVEKDGKLLKPKKKGYNSLYYHELTKDFDEKYYIGWGLQLFNRCKGKIQYYYIKRGTRKVNVYPNDVIEKWFNEEISKSVESLTPRQNP